MDAKQVIQYDGSWLRVGVRRAWGALGVGLLVFGLAAWAHAAVDTWDGGASTDYYDLNTNWADDTRPVSANSVMFNLGGNYNVLFDATTDTTYGGSPRVADLDVSSGNVSFKTDSGATPRALLVDGDVSNTLNHVQVLSGSLSLGDPANAAKKFELVAGNNIEIQTGALNVYPGSRLAGDIIAVGSVGTTGSLLVSGADATVFTLEGRIASEPGTAGSVIVTGEGARWDNANLPGGFSTVFVGSHGSGTLQVQAGADVTSEYMFVGYESGSSGTATVSGIGSTLTTDGPLEVGFFGSGEFNVQSSGVVNSGDLLVGRDSLSTGLVTVTGAGSQLNTLEVGFHNVIGEDGTGTLRVLAGGVVSLNGHVNVGIGHLINPTGGNGTVEIDNATFTHSGSGVLKVGDPTLGVAKIDVKNGGVFSSSTGTSTVYKTGRIDLKTGGTYNANGHLVINDGTFDNAAGTFNLAAGKNVTVQNTGLLSFTGSYSLKNNSTLTVNSGSLATFGTYLDIGDGSTGTLNVSGTGSSVGASSLSFWGYNGGVAVISASSGAVLNLNGGLELARSSTAGTSATVQVLSGADMSIGGSFLMAANGGGTTMASLTIDGAGSSVVHSGNSTVVIGHASTGAATLTVRNSSLFSMTGVAHNTEVRRTGRINIESGGAFSSVGDVVLNGGMLHHDGGSLTLASGKKLQANNLGVVETLGGTLAVSDLETNSGSAVNVGQLSPPLASTMNVTFWTANGGTAYVSPGSTLNVASVTFNAGATLNVDGGGTANVTYATIIGGTTLGDGTLNLLASIYFAEVTTTLGVPTAFRSGSSVSFVGENPNFDIQISRRAFVDAGVTFNPGSGTNRLVNQAASAISLEPNSIVGIPLVNQGAIRLSENTPFATATVASFEQSATGTIFFDLLSPAQLDRFIVSGAATLGGTLDVQSQPGFTPAVGQSFDLFDWNGGVSGAFTNVLLPTLGGGLGWNTSQLYTTGVLSIAAAGVPGDYNNNGTVDAADYVLWRNGGPLANEVDTPGTVNAADYTAWRARFGNMSGSGASLDGSGTVRAAVPEPTAAMLIAAAVVCVAWNRRIDRTLHA